MHRRIDLADGARATVHVVRHALASLRLSLVRLQPEAPLEDWCAEHGISEAVSGGYATKPDYEPLGELWIGGRAVPHRPFRAPWDARRAVLAHDGRTAIDTRDRFPGRPAGDLLQAGPLLVRDGRNVVAGVADPEGFSSTADEFDEDITADREPRLALALTGDALLAVAVDGRGGPDDAGLTLGELGNVLVGLGARSAINLDGGSAGVVVSGGRRMNTPRDDEGDDMASSSPSVTAIVLGDAAR